MVRRSTFALGAGIAMALGCGEAPPRLHLERASVGTGEDVVVSFDEPLSGRSTNQYWIALQPADAPASETRGRIVLLRSDRTVRVRSVAPGDFEIRLHGDYPREESHLLVRLPVKIEGWPVKTGIEQKI